MLTEQWKLAQEEWNIASTLYVIAKEKLKPVELQDPEIEKKVQKQSEENVKKIEALPKTGQGMRLPEDVPVEQTAQEAQQAPPAVRPPAKKNPEQTASDDKLDKILAEMVKLRSLGTYAICYIKNLRCCSRIIIFLRNCPQN